jgi:hypothetical protein
MGQIGVKTGSAGNIRRVCSAFHWINSRLSVT